MMKKTIFYLFISVAALSACEKKNHEKEILSFDLNQERLTLSELDLVKDYEVVALQTSSDAKIGKIDKVIKKGDRIYVLDKDKAKSVFVFDYDGKIVNTINRFGSASDEYLQLADIYVDDEDSTLSLLSRLPSKILQFNHDGDSLLNIIPLERSFERFEKMNDNYFAFQGNFSQGADHHNVCTLSENGEIISSEFDIFPGWESTFSNEIQPFGPSVDKSLLFIPPYTYDVYRLDNKLPGQLLLSLDFGEQNIPSELNSFEAQRANNTSDLITSIYRFAETENHRLFHVIYKGQNVLLVNDKRNNENNCATLEIDYFKYFLPFGRLVALDGDEIITYVDASDMDFYLSGKNEYNDFTEEYPTQIENLNRRLGEVNPEDNPLLIFYNID